MSEETLPRKASRPMSFNNAADLWVLCKQYFEKWELENTPLTVVGLAVYLDVCKDTLNEYGKGTYDSVDEDFSVTVKKAKDYIENHKWVKALKGEYNAAVSIFDLKNNHGATDSFAHTGKNGESLQAPSQTTIILTDKAIDEALQRQNEKY